MIVVIVGAASNRAIANQEKARLEKLGHVVAVLAHDNMPTLRNFELAEMNRSFIQGADQVFFLMDVSDVRSVFEFGIAYALRKKIDFIHAASDEDRSLIQSYRNREEQEKGQAMTRGKVKWFDDAKGYGFVAVDGAGANEKDVFVHYSDIKTSDKRRSLTEGQSVEFEIGQGERGRKAVNVRPVV